MANHGKNTPSGQGGKANNLSSKRKKLSQEANNFIQSAKAFEQSEIERVKRFSKIAWTAAGLCLLVAGLAIGAVVGLTPLKTVEPFVLRVDNSTGAVDIVTTMKQKEASYGEIVDKYWLAQYVRYREGYDWQTIQSTYDATMLLSAPPVQSDFAKLFSHETAAPHKILKDKFRIEIEITSVAFIGKENAQVRYIKRTLPNVSSITPPPPQKYIATLAYEYKNAPQAEKDRLINPLGFQVLSWRTDLEAVE